MPFTAQEQYLIELINRSRLDPEAEAARLGISLNSGLASGTLQGGSRQVLAPDAALDQAATAHSQWMLAEDVFSHTGSGGSSPGTRASAAGYSWSGVGENISWTGTTGTLNLSSAIAQQHDNLFRSAGHRANMLNDYYRELGVAQEAGVFTTSSGTGYNASMVTELFGRSGSQVFVTGVVFNDTSGDKFYSIGEGVAGASFSSGGSSQSTASAGGYGIAVSASGATQVTGSAGGGNFSVTVDTRAGNVKLDVMDGDTFRSSGSTTLGGGIDNLTLLGTNGLRGKGNGNANEITGNDGNNKLFGGGGNDSLMGDDGNDKLRGNTGNDTITGGDGNDWMAGNGGNDLLIGGQGADRFVFSTGHGQDVIDDFSISQGDKLSINDAIWGGAARTAQELLADFAEVTADGVLIRFDANTSILLDGLTSMSGLAAQIDII